jgi:hypothetical protein
MREIAGSQRSRQRASQSEDEVERVHDGSFHTSDPQDRRRSLQREARRLANDGLNSPMHSKPRQSRHPETGENPFGGVLRRYSSS